MKIVTSGILDSLRVCLIRLRSGLSSFFITEEDRDSPDRLKEDLEAENGPKADPALIETISRNVGPAADWLFNDLKVEFTKRPCPDFSKTDPRRTGSFVKCIDKNALFFLQQFQKLGGLVLTETNMTNLLTEKGRVSGIEYSCPEEKNKKNSSFRMLFWRQALSEQMLLTIRNLSIKCFITARRKRTDRDADRAQARRFSYQ